jgi:2-polyprenyl-6-hydroxyphenyl methylase / 3-demethylubiquinone-9 3-methyltransferase
MSTANVDTSEIERFDALAAQWWDPNGALKPLHDMNPLRLDYVDARAQLAGKRVLDVGCGGGLLAEGMARRGAKVLGIDLSAAAIEAARAHASAGAVQIEYREVAIEALDASHERHFDVVTCLELLEHVPDPSSLIAGCARRVRPGGHLFFSTINRNPKAYLLAVVAAEYVLGWLPRGTHDYARFLKPSEIDAWARMQDLAIEDLSGMQYDPLTQRWSLSRNVDVNYLAHYRAGDGAHPG